MTKRRVGRPVVRFRKGMPSDRVAQDRRKRGLAWNIGLANTEGLGARRQRPTGDFVDHAIGVRTRSVRECDSTGRHVDGSVNDLVDVDQECVDGSEGGSASGLSDVADRTPLLSTLIVKRRESYDFAGIDLVEDRSSRVGERRRSQLARACCDRMLDQAVDRRRSATPPKMALNHSTKQVLFNERGHDRRRS